MHIKHTRVFSLTARRAPPAVVLCSGRSLGRSLGRQSRGQHVLGGTIRITLHVAVSAEQRKLFLVVPSRGNR